MILLHESKKASFALRLATLLALTLMFAFTALVALDNRELHKVLPHSWLRSYAMLFGYAVGILSASYATALRGRNFIGWKDELLIALNFFLLFAALTLPSLFPVFRAEGSWLTLGLPLRKVPSPNTLLYAVALLQIPLLIITVKRVRTSLASKQ